MLMPNQPFVTSMVWEVGGMLAFPIYSCNMMLNEPVREHMMGSKSARLTGVWSLTLLGVTPGMKPWMTPCWFYERALLRILANWRAPVGKAKEAFGHSLSCETRHREELDMKHHLHQQPHILLSMAPS